MIKAAIFDMDGLLIDSEPFWRKAHIEVLAKHGYKITEDDVRAMAGRSTPEVVKLWQKRFGWPDKLNQPIEIETVQCVIDLVHEQGRMMPGVEKLIKLFQTKHLKLAVASSSSPELIAVALDKLDLTKHMDIIHSAMHEKRAKPSPDVYLATARQLGVMPAECLVFEDSPNGVKAAKAAGMRCVAVPDPVHKTHPYIQAADVIIDSLEQFDTSILNGK